jgi:drug/metabolite transporter (DMT)-like permease
MTSLIGVIIFLPLTLIERKQLKVIKEKNTKQAKTIDSLLNGWKKNKNLLLIIGVIFSAVQVLFFLGYQLAGAINGSLARKTEIIFILLFGFIILKEKITKNQILFSVALFFGLILAVTNGSLNLIEFNIGVLILIVNACIWAIGHSFTKVLFDKNQIFPFQMLLFRNLISGAILFGTYFLFYPLENINLLYNLTNYYYFILMGIFYNFGIYFWYKTISYLDISIATQLTSLTTIVSAFFGMLILGEEFTVFHIIGTGIVICSIYFIFREKKIKLK